MLSNSNNDEFLPSSSADVVESPRKRMRLDTAARKSWSLMDGKTDNDVLQEMGVSLLEPDENETHCDTSTSIHKTLKRKHDIENVNPNITSPRCRHSPKSPRVKCSPGPGPSRVRSPRSSEKAKPLQPIDQSETTLISDYLVDEETPLAQSISADYPLAHTGFGAPAGTKKCTAVTPLGLQEELMISRRSKSDNQGDDTFSVLSDEMMLSVFRWLPKRTLAHCMLVCKRWYRVACDETLWQRLDLGNKTLSKDALGRIIAKKPVIIRLAGSEIGNWTPSTDPGPSRIQYLDLSMCTVEPDTLNSLLRCCPSLRKLSLENVGVDDCSCELIGKCTQLETLNLAMVRGLTTDGIVSILEGCTGLNSLNLAWCHLSESSLQVLVELLPQKLQRLNISGAKALTDDLLGQLAERCPRLLELDASDCSRLCDAVQALHPLRRLEHLALSRCYLVPPHALTKLGALAALQFLELWGTLQSASVGALRAALPAVQLNQFMFSAIARPTVGTRRTSIWGLRTRD
ncbi:S-phase kinase-associated protein 2-like [Epargyreus clarus]|uniref:S-phase kinase-associated protein 2-like n=1 Tax=Epargyreus clarus TaxID=520877 RepID=UPI003C2E4664